MELRGDEQEADAPMKPTTHSNYGAVHGNHDVHKPALPPRSTSEQRRPSWTASTPMLHQSSSVRALLRVTNAAQTSPRASESHRISANGTSTKDQHSRPEGAPLLRRSATTSQIPPLLRAMSSFFVPPSTTGDQFRCFICFDDVAVNEAVALSTCGHRYCTSCFQSYLSSKINDGYVYPVCFHPLDHESATQKTCGVAVSDAQIESIVDADVWTKFNRFRFTQEHEHARECPYCSHTQECTGPSNPACVCAQCTKTFCFFHGNAHEDGTCADYELKNAETDASSRAKIDEIAKPCPGCKRDVEKDGGCNHMKCVACATSFCWLCGEAIDDSPMPAHFLATSGNACGGKQFDGMNANLDIPWWAIAYGLLLLVLCWPIAFVAALVIAPFAWCLSPHESISTKFWTWHTLGMIALSLTFSLVFFLSMLMVELSLRLAGFVVKLPVRAVAFVMHSLQTCCRSRPTPATKQTHVDLEAGSIPKMDATETPVAAY